MKTGAESEMFNFIYLGPGQIGLAKLWAKLITGFQ